MADLAALAKLGWGERHARQLAHADRRLRAQLIAGDGNNCRYCGNPLIPESVRKRAHKLYPVAVPWGRTNLTQHAAFQAMWLQFDHVVPHSRGGTNEPDNLVLCCAPCNYGKVDFMLEELGLNDPRIRNDIMRST